MKRIFSICIMVALAGATFAQDKVFSITASPAENTRREMNFSWATDKEIPSAMLEVTAANDQYWKRSKV